jgi:hypothetical protein
MTDRKDLVGPPPTSPRWMRRSIMPNQAAAFRGTVHGNTITLDGELGIPDGQEVTVTVQVDAPAAATKRLPPGEGFGAWAEDGDELDRYIASVYEHRRTQQRRPIE